MPRIVTSIHDPQVLFATCRQLGLALPREGAVQLGADTVRGWIVRLPGPRSPIVCDTLSGLVAYHPLDGLHERYQHIMHFIERYYAVRVQERRDHERRCARKGRARIRQPA
jgi:hypothetical protein